jgi:hypothetical protein
VDWLWEQRRPASPRGWALSPEATLLYLCAHLSLQHGAGTPYLPWLIVMGGIIMLGRGFGEYVKTRVHARDEHGAVPLLQMKASNGDTILVKAEDLETGVMKVGKDGSVIRYAPMDEREQSDIKRRNQAVEAIRALPTPYAQTGAKIVTSEFSSTHARVTVGNPAPMNPVTDEADQGFLEEIKND